MCQVLAVDRFFAAASRRGYFVVVIAATLTCCADGALPEPSSTSVCEILAAPSRFSGRVVKLSASLKLGYHYNILMDEHCPKDGITLLIGEAARTRDDTQPLLKFTDALGVDAQSKRVKGVFEGEIQSHPADVPAVELDLQSVSNIEEITTR